MVLAMANGDAPNSHDVFLSYGSPDKAWVRALHAHLEAIGVACYRDEIAIDAGDNWVRHLSDGIERASALVLVVSLDTMDREWVEQEWTSFMATHGPRKTIIPVTLDHVELPSFLKPFQAIHAIDRNVEAIAARIARALGKGNGSTPDGAISGLAPSPGLPAPYTGQSLIFTIASVSDSAQLEVTSTDGTRRTVAAPWRQDNKFAIALMEGHHLFEAGDYDRASLLLGWASERLLGWGRFREALQLLVPFSSNPVDGRMTRETNVRLMGTIGLAYSALGDRRRAIEFFEQSLVISREIGARQE